MSFSNLREMLIRHEGCRLKLYKCTADKWSIGVGRNVQEFGISKVESDFLLTNDINRVIQEATNNFAWFNWLNVARQDAIADMLFMGLPAFLEFKNMIAALSAQNYNKAADEMLNSKWASQVGIRAVELAQIMRSGIYV